MVLERLFSLDEGFFVRTESAWAFIQSEQRIISSDWLYGKIWLVLIASYVFRLKNFRQKAGQKWKIFEKTEAPKNYDKSDVKKIFLLHIYNAW